MTGYGRIGRGDGGSNVPGDILHGLGNPSFCLAGIIINRCVMLTEKKRGAQKEIRSLLPLVQSHDIHIKIEYATVCDILI
jgi:aerobic-type carbon monoxide dehydrogenase small subunit (CoxS/CutS family)